MTASAARDRRGAEQGVLAAYSGYLAAFQRLDRAATAACFTVPLCRVKAGRVAACVTCSDVADMLAAIWAGLAAKDYARAAVAGTRVTMLDERTALLRAHGTRYNRAGDPFEQFDVLYTYVRAGEGSGWKIAVLASASPGG